VRAARGEIGEEWKLDGKDLLPTMRGEEKGIVHDRLFWRIGNQRAMRQGRWKITSEGGWHETPTFAPAESWKLFDLQADPGEKTDLTAKHPDTMKQMRQVYDAWETLLIKIPLNYADNQPIPQWQLETKQP
jgi:arylsulfatase A-like enzyme